ncbi:hypothetical protein [Mesorhizobium sp.]|uniref:hypothetical protein n=1 Tax=Mesorhizobium sp. TaxID=1871066 RepID=UPI0025F473A7|nr:hypothetical protein [Mesorhizobium sp.]
MRKLLLASVIAIASAAATIAPADAHRFLGLGFGPFGGFYNDYGPYPFYGPYYGGYRDYYDDYYPGYVVRYPHYSYYRHQAPPVLLLPSPVLPSVLLPPQAPP